MKKPGEEMNKNEMSKTGRGKKEKIEKKTTT